MDTEAGLGFLYAFLTPIRGYHAATYPLPEEDNRCRISSLTDLRTHFEMQLCPRPQVCLEGAAPSRFLQSAALPIRDSHRCRVAANRNPSLGH